MSEKANSSKKRDPQPPAPPPPPPKPVVIGGHEYTGTVGQHLAKAHYAKRGGDRPT